MLNAGGSPLSFGQGGESRREWCLRSPVIVLAWLNIYIHACIFRFLIDDQPGFLETLTGPPASPPDGARFPPPLSFHMKL